MPGELRAPLIVIESVPEGTVSIRAPLVTLEPLTEGINSLRDTLLIVEPLTEHFRQLRGALVIVEPLTEHFRTLRMPLLVIESLHPVAPEGTVSTELFPGSQGSVRFPCQAFSGLSSSAQLSRLPATRAPRVSAFAGLTCSIRSGSSSSLSVPA
jgi:hypothetical protein